jgi:hypothetical protein
VAFHRQQEVVEPHRQQEVVEVVVHLLLSNQ